MLELPKRLADAVVSFVNGVGSAERKSAYRFEDDRIIAPIGNAAFFIWDIWRRTSAWPLGNWLDAPLPLLAQVQTIDTIYNALAYAQKKDANWGKLSQTQIEIIRNLL